MKTPKILLQSVFFVLLAVFSHQEIALSAWVWSPDIGKWMNPKKASKDTPEDQFAWAMSFYEKKDYDRAIEEFEKMPVDFPNSKLSAESVYYTGLAYEQKNDAAKAVDNYQKLVDRYPYSDRIKDAIEREFVLAGKFAEGEKIKVANIALLPGQDKAIEIYRHIVLNAPYGSFGDKAQYQIGEVYAKVGDFDEAVRAYQAVVDEYPDSDLVTKAKYQIAQMTMKASEKARYNEEVAQKAIDEFEAFKKAHPEAEQISAADQTIKILREKKAQKNLETAQFYDKQGKRNSAKIYYGEIVNKYADTSYLASAKKRYDELNGQIEKSSTSAAAKEAPAAQNTEKTKSKGGWLPKVKLWPW